MLAQCVGGLVEKTFAFPRQNAELTPGPLDLAELTHQAIRAGIALHHIVVDSQGSGIGVLQQGPHHSATIRHRPATISPIIEQATLDPVANRTGQVTGIAGGDFEELRHAGAAEIGGPGTGEQPGRVRSAISACQPAAPGSDNWRAIPATPPHRSASVLTRPCR